MDIRPVTPRYAVSPQIAPEDVAAIKEAGFTRIICNRPDAENPPELRAAAVEAAAREAGIDFVNIPLTYPQMTPERIAEQMAAIEDTAGPVLAYCASGNRSSQVWALANAGKRPTDELIGLPAKFGYQLEGLRGSIDALAARG